MGHAFFLSVTIVLSTQSRNTNKARTRPRRVILGHYRVRSSAKTVNTQMHAHNLCGAGRRTNIQKELFQTARCLGVLQGKAIKEELRPDDKQILLASLSTTSFLSCVCMCMLSPSCILHWRLYFQPPLCGRPPRP